MKKIILYIVKILAFILIVTLVLMLLNKNAKNYERETAKMGVDWETNTCYLYWE